MMRNWNLWLVALTMMASPAALAQDNSGGATSGGVTSGATEPMTPNAPVQATPDAGPLPAGDEAGVTTASGWAVDPLAVGIGVAVVGAAICIAVCDSGHSSTSSTTTTAHK